MIKQGGLHMTIFKHIRQGSQIQSKGPFYTVLAVTCIIIGLLAYLIFFTYQTRSASLRLSQANQASIQALKDDIEAIKTRMAGTDNESVKNQHLPLTSSGQARVQDGSSNVQMDHKTGIPFRRGDDKRPPGSGAPSTPLTELARNENLDPEVLQEIYDERMQQKDIEQYRKKLIDWNAEQRKIDKEQYGEELDELYQHARLARGTGVSAEEREAAFNELLEKYPDSYAAAKLISDRAFLSALMKRDISETEKYYDMLMANDNDYFRNVVTDTGMEAVPAIEHNLAYLYLRDGRIDEAKSMLDSLDTNYPESFVIIRTPPSGRRFVPVQEAVSMARQRSHSARQ
jgi:tetratricopeptide (TPR) repeat protein